MPTWTPQSLLHPCPAPTLAVKTAGKIFSGTGKSKRKRLAPELVTLPSLETRISCCPRSRLSPSNCLNRLMCASNIGKPVSRRIRSPSALF